MAYQTSDIRNVALVGHAGAGKTMLLEQLLVEAGAIREAGAIEKGSTVSDWDDLEKQHGHSLSASLAGFDVDGTHLNLLDTPGYPDFVGTALSVLPAVETVAVVINAERGIESTSRRMMSWAEDQDQCRMVVINHIDGDGVDLEAVYQAVQENFGSECLAVNLPKQGGDGVIDCFFKAEGNPDRKSTRLNSSHSSVSRMPSSA